MQAIRKTAPLLALATLAALAAHPAHGQTYTARTVSATDSIEAAGQAATPGGATFPTAYAVAGGGTLTFTSVTGSITFNNANFNDPDGVGSVSDSSINAANGISAITHTSKAGYLVGLFTTSAAPAGTAPAGLTFSDPGSATGINTNFATLSPLPGQAFFIGDGLTGDGTGAAQRFFIPAGATRLYLGFADAGGYHGDPRLLRATTWAPSPPPSPPPPSRPRPPFSPWARWAWACARGAPAAASPDPLPPIRLAPYPPSAPKHWRPLSAFGTFPPADGEKGQWHQALRLRASPRGRARQLSAFLPALWGKGAEGG